MKTKRNTKTPKNSPPVQFRCTQEEFEKLKLLAEKHMPGVSVAAFVRGIVLTFVKNQEKV